MNFNGRNYGQRRLLVFASIGHAIGSISATILFIRDIYYSSMKMSAILMAMVIEFGYVTDFTVVLCMHIRRLYRSLFG